ncbi:MAG TPA: hypothetical protein VI729_04510 [Anaerolineales bacterium]|nr:hypothetical protein [Anaerolineales bacterium]
MKIGMLWFDNDPKADLKVKIERAASYYSKKYGQAPNLCFVHPSMAPAPNGKPDSIEIRANRSVRPNHFWIGVADQAVQP